MEEIKKRGLAGRNNMKYKSGNEKMKLKVNKRAC